MRVLDAQSVFPVQTKEQPQNEKSTLSFMSTSVLLLQELRSVSHLQFITFGLAQRKTNAFVPLRCAPAHIYRGFLQMNRDRTGEKMTSSELTGNSFTSEVKKVI